MAFVDLCRLCGTDTLNIVRNAIFGGEGRVKKYALKISECLTLKVAEEDQLPKIMCGECSYKLDLLSDFRDVAYKTETQLLSKIDVNKVKAELPDVIDSPDLDNEDFGGDDNSCSSSPEPLPEPLVEIKEEENLPKKRSPTKRSWRVLESEGEETPVKKRGRPPKQPPATTSKAAAATPAAASTTPVAAPPKENSGSSKGPGVAAYHCQGCHHRFPTEAELQKHMRTCVVSGQKLRVYLECNLCGEFRQTKKEMESHINTHATLIPGVIMCGLNNCAIVFSTPEELKEHRNTTPSHKLHMKKFDDTIKVVERVHQSLQTYACDICDCKFLAVSPNFLILHMENFHQDSLTGDASYKCHLCKKTFAFSKSLELHLKLHDKHIKSKKADELRNKNIKKRGFKCEGCHISPFNSQEELDTHQLQMHLGCHIKCVHCNKGFLNKAAYDVHLENHKTDQPGVFNCVVSKVLVIGPVQKEILACDFPNCLYQGASAQELKFHRKSVHSIWPYHCQFCDKGADCLSLHLLHTKRHETGKEGLIKCSQCKMIYSTIADLREHLKCHNRTTCQVCQSVIKGGEAIVRAHAETHKIKTPDVIKSASKSDTRSNRKAKNQKTSNPVDSLYACNYPECNAEYNCQALLLTHKDKVHTFALVDCHICGKQLTNQYYLSKHITQMHKMQQIPVNEDSNLTGSDECPKVLVEQHAVFIKEEIGEVIFE